MVTKKSDGLVKGPAIGGVKGMYEKSFEIQEKYEKMMGRRGNGNKGDRNQNQVHNSEMESIRTEVEELNEKLSLEKKRFRIVVGGLVLLYIVTVFCFLVLGGVFDSDRIEGEG